MPELNKHKTRHIELHHALDELFADAIVNGDISTESTIMDLITWSFEQTKNVQPEEQSNAKI